MNKHLPVHSLCLACSLDSNSKLNLSRQQTGRYREKERKTEREKERQSWRQSRVVVKGTTTECLNTRSLYAHRLSLQSTATTSSHISITQANGRDTPVMRLLTFTKSPRAKSTLSGTDMGKHISVEMTTQEHSATNYGLISASAV